jgi:hypothetical protein
MQSLFAADGADVSGVVQRMLSYESKSDKELSSFVHKQIQGLSDEGRLALCSSDEIQTSSLLPIVSYFILHEHRTRSEQEKKSKLSVLAESINEIAATAQRACLWDAIVDRKNDDKKEIILEHQLTGEQVVAKADLFKCVPAMLHCAGDCGISVASDELLTQGVSSLLRNDSVGDVKLLMQILKSVYTEDKQKLTAWINALSGKQLNWLYQKANYLDLAEVQKLCAARIAKELKELKEIEILPAELEHKVKQLVDVKPLFDAMQSRSIVTLDVLLLGKYENICSICYNKAGNALWIGTGNRILIYDIVTGALKDTDFVRQDDEYINSVSSVVYNQAENKLLIRTNHGVFKDTGFVLQENEYIQSVGYNKAKNKLLISTNKRVLIYDIVTGSLKDTGFVRQQGEVIWSVCYNRAGDALLIGTSDRVLIYDIVTGVFKDTGFVRQNYEYIESVGFNRAEDELLIKTNKRVFTYDIVKKTFKDIGVKRQENEVIWSVYYNRAEDALLIGTNKRILLLPLSHRLLPQLSLNQLKFLMYKALPAWQKKQSYKMTEGDKEIYESLPDSLKQAQFFNNDEHN